MYILICEIFTVWSEKGNFSDLDFLKFYCLPLGGIPVHISLILSVLIDLEGPNYFMF